MSLKTGTYQELKIERESPFGYFLSDGREDVLLHYSETNHQKLEISEKVTVFLYSDHKGRIAATLYRPKIILGESGFLEVQDFHPKLGFFLNLGINKEILLPLDELPEDHSIWPVSGHLLFVKLSHDKQGRLLAELSKEDTEIQAYISRQKTLEDDEPVKQNQFVEGIVIRHITAGIHLYLETHQIGFLHRSEQTKELKLGEKVRVRTTLIREDGKINVSMKPLKQVSRIEDADKLLDLLYSRGGSMPYSDSTPPDIIQEKFQMSKAAFKRALGKLMKDGKVYQSDGWTYLKE